MARNFIVLVGRVVDPVGGVVGVSPGHRPGEWRKYHRYHRCIPPYTAHLQHTYSCSCTTPPLRTVSQFRGSATPIKINLFSMFYYIFFLMNYVTEPHEHYSVFVKKAYNI